MFDLTRQKLFWGHVHKTEACWLWVGSKLDNRYGAFCKGNSRNISAHRYSYMIHNGDIPKGMCVCHACDNPLCVNPAHLWLGTPRDNTEDMLAKGRHGQSNKTQCPQGHAYDKINTYVIPTGGRGCRQCMRARNKANRTRKKLKEIA